MYRILLPIILLIVVLSGAGYYFLNHQNKLEPTPLPQGHVCEPDSMVCSDGTVLKRQGPSCDFPPCPGSESTGSGIMPSYTPVPDSSRVLGEEVTISGTTICLPHKNSSGLQTMECALGIKGDDGNNYGLNDPGWKYLMGTGNGIRVKIMGKLEKKQDSKYDSAGVITIETLIKL